MKQLVFIASDHGGFKAKAALKSELINEFEIRDLGPDKLIADDDYPIYAAKVAYQVVQNPGSMGLLICRSGEGMEIAANKVMGVRAVIAWNEQVALESRNDNDSNVLSLPADYLSVGQMGQIVRAWLRADFSFAPRHTRRIEQISQLERDRTIVPAILEQKLADLRSNLKVAAQCTNHIQIDVIDGVFANNRTVALAKLPMVLDMLVDLDMMVTRPSKYIQQVHTFSPRLAIFHLEASESPFEYLHAYQAAHIPIGLAINPDTPVSSLKPYLDEITHVLIMGVPAGFAHQKFQSKVLMKVAQVRELDDEVEIGIDGGVSLDNIAEISKTAVDIVNVNSAFFESENPSDAYCTLSEALQ